MSTQVDENGVEIPNEDQLDLAQGLTTEDILAQRGSVYGPYRDNAELTQNLYRVILNARLGKNAFSPTQSEALHMICHKIARLTIGDPNHIDGWDDIAGYASLEAKELRSQTNASRRYTGRI